MSEVLAQINEVVAPAEGTNQPYRAKTTEGTYKTFKTDIGSALMNSVGKFVKIDYAEVASKDPRFPRPDLFVNSFTVVDGPAPVTMQQVMNSGTGVSSSNGSSDQRSLEIARAVALKAATEIAIAWFEPGDQRSSNVVILAEVFREYLTDGASLPSLTQPPSSVA
jgi:hypothetical protein